MTTLSLHLSKAAHEGTLHRQKNHTIHSVHFISVTDTIVKSARSPWHELNCRLMFQERCDVKFMQQMRRAAAWPAGRMKTSLVLRLKGIVNATPSPPTRARRPPVWAAAHQQWALTCACAGRYRRGRRSPFRHRTPSYQSCAWCCSCTTHLPLPHSPQWIGASPAIDVVNEESETVTRVVWEPSESSRQGDELEMRSYEASSVNASFRMTCIRYWSNASHT